MTREELLKEKQYLSTADIMQIFDCGKNTAYRIIREVKAVSKILPIAGKISVADYELWIEKMKNKGGLNSYNDKGEKYVND